MYKAKNVDTDKALEALNEARVIQARITDTEIKEKRAFLAGVNKGLDIAESLFTCSNYEKEGDLMQALCRGNEKIQDS